MVDQGGWGGGSSVRRLSDADITRKRAICAIATFFLMVVVCVAVMVPLLLRAAREEHRPTQEEYTARRAGRRRANDGDFLRLNDDLQV